MPAHQESLEEPGPAANPEDEVDWNSGLALR
jgi:hypothetical protein